MTADKRTNPLTNIKIESNVIMTTKEGLALQSPLIPQLMGIYLPKTTTTVKPEVIFFLVSLGAPSGITSSKPESIMET